MLSYEHISILSGLPVDQLKAYTATLIKQGVWFSQTTRVVSVYGKPVAW